MEEGRAQITLIIPVKWKRTLDIIAHERSIESGRRVTTLSIIREALDSVFHFDEEEKGKP